MSATAYCRHCAATIDETAAFCSTCGASQPGVAQPGSRAGASVRRTFGSSIRICLRNYVGFEGRAPRAEYWYFVLFTIICQIAADIVGVASGTSYGASGLGGLVALALFLPSLAVSVRRLHDINRSGWWYLIVFVPIVGWILLLVWACTRGTGGPNRFGPDQLPAEG
ncbi:MAG: DUF805 domain-containing protein [Acetobacteraceae bacterium]